MTSRAKLLLLLAVLVLSAPAIVVAQDPVAHWTFDSDDGTQVVDVSGYGNHGELTGPVSYGEGVLGRSITFNGGGEHIEVPASIFLDDLDAFTFAAWIKTADDSNQVIMAKDYRKAYFKIGAFRNYIDGCVRVGGGFVCSRSFDGVIATGQWAFVAMTYDGGADRRVHLYIDGEEVRYKRQTVAAADSSRTPDSGAPFAIGAMPGSGTWPFNGHVDEVRVFSRALNAGAIRNMLEQDLGAPRTDAVPPLVVITDPDSSLVQTNESSIDLAGVAVDASGIVDVGWSNGRGDFGNAAGGANWVAASVPLSPDENVISVTARDAAGNAGSASLRVIRVEDAPGLFEGYGAGTTGGTGYPSFVAASPAELDAVLDEVKNRGGNAIINLSGSWEYGSTVMLAHVKNVTLNGLGADVTLRNRALVVRCSENVVLQGLRVRNDQTGGDAIQIDSSERVVIDHNSASGAGDGNIDITGWSCGPSRYITVSWNIFANTWKQSLIKYGGTTQVSVHHNLFYNSGNRLPALQSAGEFDIRNNIFWQWGNSGTTLQFGATANLIGNVYEAGVANRGHAAIWYQDDLSKAWIADNLVPRAETDVSRLDQPLSVPATTTHAPDIARTLVVEGAGAWPRDQYDADATAAVAGGVFTALPPFHD